VTGTELDPGRMREAIGQAREAERQGEVPIGAVVVSAAGAIVGRGRNSSRNRLDPTAHAEVLALREAASALGNYRLEGADIFVTLEPCLMCVGALVHARIRRLVFAARDPKAGAAWILDAPWPGGARLNHRIEVVGGVVADECGEMLRNFFRDRR
jgi:tRNA(adenine34) deaminase